MSSLRPRAFGDLFTLVRASTASYIDANGEMQTAAVDEPRVDYDPATLAARGLLVEGARTNVLLNSATLATQSVSVTAQAYALSFYGTGSVALSGAHSATLAGTGAKARVSLVFTPGAGTLTLTVTGDVRYAQLEAGPFSTSWISTAGSPVARSADQVSLKSSSPITAEEGSLLVEYLLPWAYNAADVASTRLLAQLSDGTAANRHRLYLLANQRKFGTDVASVAQADLTLGAPVQNAVQRMAYAWAANDFAAAGSGGLYATDTSATAPQVISSVTMAGSSTAGTELCGYLRKVKFYPRRLSTSELRALVD